MISKSETNLIRIKENDLLKAVMVYARAFQNDPYFLYTLRDGPARPAQVSFLMRITAKYCRLYGEIYATKGFEAVAAWMPPASGNESNWRMIRAGALPAIWKIGPAAIRRYLLVEQICDRLHARYAPDPHWYLSQLGVEPLHQGKGFGTMVLQPTLKRIDEAGKAVYLETLNPKAVPFYQKLGFGVCEEVFLPHGGPPMWVMRRESSHSW